MTRILGSSRSAIVASRRVRRRQDDNRAARPPDPSLRNHRNRQRELALQTPRLSATPACPGGQTGTSHARRSVAREGTARRARDPPVRYRDKPTPPPVRGPFSLPIRGPDCLPFDMESLAPNRQVRRRCCSPKRLHGRRVSSFPTRPRRVRLPCPHGLNQTWARGATRAVATPPTSR